MKKDVLEKFIKKYYLNGLINSVQWTIKNKQLVTLCNNEHKNVFVNLYCNNFEGIIDTELGINETGKLIKLLSTLDNDIECNLITRNNGVISSVAINDSNSTVYYVTADLTVIPSDKKTISVSKFDLELILDKSIIDRYISAKNALQDVETFSFVKNKKDEIELVLGYSKINTNRVKLNITLKDGSILKNKVSFHADSLKELLQANKEYDTPPTFKVAFSPNGALAVIEFKSGNYIAKYGLTGNYIE